ncbi:hypothetical protein BV20DRAFT_1050800 [Pilatotrama ljubarskyi]|nr:hypothetical protein BV20DRAFT_1050800 [Pilatotrama ljubarskyi]
MPMDSSILHDLLAQLKKAQQEILDLKSQIPQSSYSADSTVTTGGAADLQPTQAAAVFPGGADIQLPTNTCSDTPHARCVSGLKYNPARRADGTFVDAIRDPADFPKVPYWNREDWKEHKDYAIEPGKVPGKRGRARMAAGMNVRFPFITDTDGTPVSGYRLQDINHSFTQYCNLLKKQDAAPTKWHSSATALVKTGYYEWMRSQFFEFQLCSNNWKAEKYAIECYPTWKKNHLTVTDGVKKSGKGKAPGSVKPECALLTTALEAAQYTISDRNHTDEPDLPSLADSSNCGSDIAPNGLPTSTTPSKDAPGTPKRGHPEEAPEELSETLVKWPRLARIKTDVSQTCAGAVPLSTSSTPPVIADAPDSITAVSPTDPASVEETASHSVPNAVVIQPASSKSSTEGQNVLVPSVSGASPEPVPRRIRNPLKDMWPSTSENTVFESHGIAPVSLCEPSGQTAVPRAAGMPTVANKAAANYATMKATKAKGDGSGQWPLRGNKQKDICARYWAAENPDKTKEDFDMYYKGLSNYSRKKVLLAYRDSGPDPAEVSDFDTNVNVSSG